ncbi:MAG: IS21 family transposase [Planctomycetota bacterium]|nr:IS21 family transposase [Planctomycetota bacterium]
MANVLKMAAINSIATLVRAGYSDRHIAAVLHVDRGTVAKYRQENQNPPNAPPGSGGDPPGHELQNPQKSPTGPDSQCEPHRELILQKLEQGLTAQRIYQDLVEDHEFTAKYHSVRRYVARLVQKSPQLVRRIEVEPGEEAQIDFGTAAFIKTTDGKRRRPWVLRVVLSHSRKAYSEVVYQQSTENFIRVLENAFRYFGGVPRKLVIDNLKAAVKQADWYDPEVHPKLQSFAQHYDTVFLPTRPYTPQHKGKVESGIKYVKNNALAGRVFSSLEEQNSHLLDWEQRVADTRIHGTTKRQVGKQFEDVERSLLTPLPVDAFPSFHEGRRTVSRDGHIEVAKAYYSMPPEYVGRRVWVRWDARLVRIFNDRWEQLAAHAKCEPGRFSTNPHHIPKKRVSAVERGTDALLHDVALIGDDARQWSQAMVQTRGIEGVRVLAGLKALAKKHDSVALNNACRKALSYGAFRLKTIRELLQRDDGRTQQQFDFLEEHPVIRPLSDYSLESLTAFRKDRNDERITG